MISNKDVNVNDLQLEDVEDYATDYPQSYGEKDAENNINIHNVDAHAASVQKPSYRKNKIVQIIRDNKWVFGLLFLMIIILIVIISIAAGSTKQQSQQVAQPNNSDGKTHQPPITIDPTTLDPKITEPLLDSLYSIYDRHGLDKSNLGPAAGDTPQNKAFYWLATDENLQKLDHTERSQRYALAVFYYATNAVATSYTDSPKPWVSAHLWLSKSHECEWKGIECNDSGHIVAIGLERNNLTGALPVEIGILGDKLHTLDLTSNLIHMEGDDFEAFADLTKLQTLLMDDNYLVYRKGLPFQFQKMVELEKLRLSYNLFSGVLEGDHEVLPQLTKLTHLEIESNFLSGTMPAIIGEMSNLVYMYVRRNELSFNLDFLKTGKLTSLCKYSYSFAIDSHGAFLLIFFVLTIFFFLFLTHITTFCSRVVVGQ